MVLRFSKSRLMLSKLESIMVCLRESYGRAKEKNNLPSWDIGDAKESAPDNIIFKSARWHERKRIALLQHRVDDGLLLSLSKKNPTTSLNAGPLT
jgi:hypothetical protein